MINDLLMMSACYCTKSCQYHSKYPIHVYSDVIQRASYLDLELYSHSWRISALQTWLHHFFCCSDVFRMITTKTCLNAPGVWWHVTFWALKCRSGALRASKFALFRMRSPQTAPGPVFGDAAYNLAGRGPFSGLWHRQFWSRFSVNGM